MRVERPAAADLAAQPQLLPVGGQDQLDGRRIEADPVVELLHLVTLVDPADREHRLQDLHVADLPRVPGEQRLQVERPVGLHDHVNPVAGDVDPGKRVHDLVDLHHDDSVMEGGRLGDHRRVFRARAGEQVPVAVGLRRAQQDDVGNQVDEHPRVQLHVGVDGADLDGPVRDQPGHPHALLPSEGEVDPPADPLLEHIQMLGQADRGDQQVQVMDRRGIQLRERPREEISLLLVISLQGHPVPGPQQRLQQVSRPFGADDPALHNGCGCLHPFLLGLPARLPVWHRVSPRLVVQWRPPWRSTGRPGRRS